MCVCGGGGATLLLRNVLLAPDIISKYIISRVMGDIASTTYKVETEYHGPLFLQCIDLHYIDSYTSRQEDILLTMSEKHLSKNITLTHITSK